jgi:hypothetical protein
MIGHGLDEGEEAKILPPPVIEIVADIAPSFTYASFQDAIPVIWSIAIDNPTAQDFARCTLELTSNSPFLRAKIWAIDRIAAGQRLPPSDRKIDLDASYLAGLDEAERGEITLRLSSPRVALGSHLLGSRLRTVAEGLKAIATWNTEEATAPGVRDFEPKWRAKDDKNENWEFRLMG